MLPKTLKRKFKTVSEKVDELILNPSDESDVSDDGGDISGKIAKFDEYELPDARSSEIRKKNLTLLSEQSVKYSGKISTRKDFETEEDEFESDDSNDVEGISSNVANKSTSFQKELQEDEISDDIEYDTSHGYDVEGDTSDSEYKHNDYDSDHTESRFIPDNIQEAELLGATNGHAEIQKGECVKNQLYIWEKLLQIRIQSQKVISKGNLLPQPEKLQNEQKENKEVKSAAIATIESCCNLLSLMLQLQNSLYNQFPEIKMSLPNKHKKSESFVDIKSKEPPSKCFEHQLQQSFKDFKHYRNSILLKWDDRTRLLSPGAGLKKKTSNEEYNIIKKIENSLLNRKLLKDKSHILQGQRKGSIGTESDSIEENNGNCMQSVSIPHVYDDSDFYLQQLRELIEYKSSGSTNSSAVTKQLIELQKLRHKMKKKVDARASKGRKIRYNVHKKLINFMAPHEATCWTEESRNELYKSLFSS